jgi:hypothetical protein
MDAIGKLDVHSWEKKENPQTYDLLPDYGENFKPRQHILGLVGGNEVPYKNREMQVDIESDLRGITRHNTFCPKRQFLPSSTEANSITRKNPGSEQKIALTKKPLEQTQMWAYPATLAPAPLETHVCQRPEKY